MSEHKLYKVESVVVSDDWKNRAYIDKDLYEKGYRQSVEDPDTFWGKEAKRLDWIKPYTRVKNTDRSAERQLADPEQDHLAFDAA